MTDIYTLERFQPYVNDAFRIGLDEGAAVEAKLLEAVAVGAPPAADNGVTDRQAFSLVFHLPEVGYMEQQIFNVQHDTLGELALFLVPVGQDQRGMRYEAMFT